MFGRRRDGFKHRGEGVGSREGGPRGRKSLKDVGLWVAAAVTVGPNSKSRIVAGVARESMLQLIETSSTWHSVHKCVPVWSSVAIFSAVKRMGINEPPG